MKTRAMVASPLFVAIALHAWASGAYVQDVFVLVVAIAAIPLGGLMKFSATTQRAVAFLMFFVGAGLGWAHTPELGYGPGTLPRTASLIAVGAVLAAVSRIYVRDTWSQERATFVLGTLSVAASGATRLGPAYGAFAAAYLALALIALRVRDEGRARARDLGLRQRADFVASILVASAAAFALSRAIPPLRDAAQRAFERAYVAHDMVGFGAGAALGEMHDMIESDVEVLRITTPRGSLPVDYLRGAVYDEYRRDGFWQETPFALRLRDVPVASEIAPRGSAVRVKRVSGSTGRYFRPLDAHDLRVGSGAVEMDALGAILTVGSDRMTEYSFVLGGRDKLAPAPARSLDLRVPRSEAAALEQLAGEWTEGAATDEDKLRAIARHLDSGYRYSLSVPAEEEARPLVPDDPLLDFLFRRKVGYCTYFASAMTLLARVSGVPARLVTGYRVAEWSPLAGELVVREKNAHAWVEAWVNGDWRTYDPTPARALPQDTAHVAPFGTLAADGIARIEQAVAYAISHVTLAQLVTVLTALTAMWVGVRRFRRRSASSATARADDHVDRPLTCFAELASSLERKGIVRGKSEPLGSFARRLEEAGLRDAARLVERYAALRYGGLGERAPLEEDVERFLGRPAASS